MLSAQTDPVPVTLKPPVPIEQPKSPFKPKVVVRPTEDPIDIYYDHDKRPEPNDKPLPTETRFIPPNPYEYDPMGGPAVRHRSQPSVRRPRSNSAGS